MMSDKTDKTGSGKVNGANVMSDQTYYQRN